MKTSLHHIVLAALASTAALCGALAQSTAPDIDLEAIRARAISEAGEADAWVIGDVIAGDGVVTYA